MHFTLLSVALGCGLLLLLLWICIESAWVQLVYLFDAHYALRRVPIQSIPYCCSVFKVLLA